MEIEGATTWRRHLPEGRNSPDFIGLAALTRDELLICALDAATVHAVGGDGTGNVPTKSHQRLAEFFTDGQAKDLWRIRRSEIVEVGFVRSAQEVRVSLSGQSPVILTMSSARHAVRVGATLGQAIFPGQEPKLDHVAVTGLQPGAKFVSKTWPLVVFAISLLVVAHLAHSDRFAREGGGGRRSAIAELFASIPLWTSHLMAAVTVAYTVYEFRTVSTPTYELRSWSAVP